MREIRDNAGNIQTVAKVEYSNGSPVSVVASNGRTYVPVNGQTYWAPV